MKLSSPIEEKKARIEIIPLIDIMFFLLACFMAVSLSMVQMRGVRVALPASSSGQPEAKNDFVTVTLTGPGAAESGGSLVYFEQELVREPAEITRRAQKLFQENPEVRIYIRADQNALHGEVVQLLDRIRSAGVQRVAFEIKAQAVTAPDAPAAPRP